MLIYLDNCVFNRPFDDQSAERIRIETTSTLHVLNEIASGRIDLAWSYVNETENRRNPTEVVRRSIQKWKEIALVEILESEKLLENARKLLELGLGIGDSLHIAAEAKADLMLTTDDRLIRKISAFEGVAIINPTEASGRLNEYIN